MSTVLKIGAALPNIQKVKVESDYRLRLKFRGKTWRSVDLQGMVARYGALSALRQPEVFAQAHVIDEGAAVGWRGDAELGASTLWHLAEEQVLFTAQDFVRWQRQAALSNTEAADALGLSLATIKNYRSGGDIPTAIAIACRAMAAEPATLAAHFRPRRAAGRPKAA